MLLSLCVRDLAVVRHCELELLDGLTVLTGETGAGKSILVDALALVLGTRADSTVVRPGARRAEIIAEFDVAALPTASRWLNEHQFTGDSGTECIVRRTISGDGRSRAYVNGSQVTLQELRTLGELLVDIHGQNEHHALLKREHHRQLLDDYADNGVILTELRTCYERWKSIKRELDNLQKAGGDRETRRDLLSYQVRELEALNIGPDEIPELESEHARLANATRLLEGCQHALDALCDNEDHAALTMLSRATRELTGLASVDRALEPVLALLDGAAVHLKEAQSELRNYGERVELDPQRLQWIDQRLAAIHDLARKHHVPAQALAEKFVTLRQELDGLEHSDERIEHLRAELDAATQQYAALAETLSNRRHEAAARLTRDTTDLIQRLGINAGFLEVALTPLGNDAMTVNGRDRVEILVSTNPKQPPRPLAKIASGGELSRVSLAIQVATIQTAVIPTLVFDEVDVGIGGGTADVVGQHLRALATKHQVLCVTHLPQVAAYGHHHLRVSKQAIAEDLEARIERLGEDERKEELARMLGGIKITETTRAHATEMMQQARAPA